MDYLEISELYHYGILGQKWGVRRYQNEDGSLTSAGKQRYSSELSSVRQQHLKEEGTRQAIANKKGTRYAYSPMTKSEEGEAVKNKVIDENLQSTKNIIGGAKEITNSASNLIKTGAGKYEHSDYSKITDDELRKRVNRLQMEEQYARLTNDTKYIKTGSDYVRETIQTAGSLLGIAGGAVSILIGLKALK